MSGESSSRTSIEISRPKRTPAELLKQVNQSFSFVYRPLVLVQENQTVPAILNCWFAGSGSWNSNC
jgi:beta-glucosidase